MREAAPGAEPATPHRLAPGTGLAIPRWLALYLVLVLAATLSPGLSVCGAPRVLLAPRLADVIGNLALFLPLGLALGRLGHASVLAAALALSCSIEAAQLLLPRTSNPYDVLANVTGAVLGRAFAARLPRIEWPLRRAAPVAIAIAVGVLLWVAALRPGLVPNDLSNWEDFPFVLGNEAEGERSWRGRLAELRIYDRTFEHDGLPPDDATGPVPWARGGPVLWMRFEAPQGARLDGPAGPRALALDPPAGEPMELQADGLHIRGGRWRLPDAVARHLLVQLSATKRFSVAVRAQTADTSLAGPARIVSFSGDSSNRNFTLGQQQRDLVLRVRTPHTGPNGSAPPVETTDGPVTGELQSILASFAGERAHIQVDGECRVERFYPMARGPFLLMTGIAPLVAGTTALGALGLAGVLGTGRRRCFGLALGGALAWGGLHALGAGSHLPGFAPIATALGLAALVACLPMALRSD